MNDYVRRPRYRLKRVIESSSQPISKWGIRCLAKGYFNVHTVGMDRKPRDNSFVEVFNHASCVDGPIAASYELHWVPHFWIQKSDPENRRNLVRRMWDDSRIWVWGQIKVRVIFEDGEIKVGNKEAIQRSKQYLKAFGKDVICVFAEGPTMEVREYVKRGEKPTLHRGAAHISRVTGKPIVPVGIYVDLPEELKPIILEAKRENIQIMRAYVREHGKIDYRISYGNPIYVMDENLEGKLPDKGLFRKAGGLKRCNFVIGNPSNRIHVEEVDFKSKRELENLLIDYSMEKCYQLAKPDNIEGKLVY